MRLWLLSAWNAFDAAGKQQLFKLSVRFYHESVLPGSILFAMIQLLAVESRMTKNPQG